MCCTKSAEGETKWNENINSPAVQPTKIFTIFFLEITENHHLMPNREVCVYWGIPGSFSLLGYCWDIKLSVRRHIAVIKDDIIFWKEKQITSIIKHYSTLYVHIVLYIVNCTGINIKVWILKFPYIRPVLITKYCNKLNCPSK